NDHENANPHVHPVERGPSAQYHGKLWASSPKGAIGFVEEPIWNSRPRYGLLTATARALRRRRPRCRRPFQAGPAACAVSGFRRTEPSAQTTHTSIETTRTPLEEPRSSIQTSRGPLEGTRTLVQTPCDAVPEARVPIETPDSPLQIARTTV